MPHDLALPILTGQIPYDVEEAITRLHTYSLEVGGALTALQARDSVLGAEVLAARKALEALQGPASSLISILRTTTLSASQVILEGFTQNSVLFVGVGGVFAESPLNFTWDDSTQQFALQGDVNIRNGFGLVVGHTGLVTIPGLLGEVQILGTISNDTAATVVRFSADASGPRFLLAKTRNALGSFGTIVQDNDELGSLIVGGDDGVDFQTAGGLVFVVDGVPAINSIPLAILFMAGTNTELMRLTAAGLLGVGIPNPDTLVSLLATGAYGWLARARLLSPADGIVTLTNAAETAFTRLNFGGTTSSFPALTRSSAALHVRLADDSAFARITALGFDMSVQQTYTVANPTTDRALDVTGDTLAQGLAVLGTLIADLQTVGLIT